jgi:hypothetical protein
MVTIFYCDLFDHTQKSETKQDKTETKSKIDLFCTKKLFVFLLSQFWKWVTKQIESDPRLALFQKNEYPIFLNIFSKQLISPYLVFICIHISDTWIHQFFILSQHTNYHVWCCPSFNLYLILKIFLDEITDLALIGDWIRTEKSHCTRKYYLFLLSNFQLNCFANE